MGRKLLLFASLFFLFSCINGLHAQASSTTVNTLRAPIVTNTSTSGDAYIVIIETVSNTDPDETFEYSMDGVNYQANPVFTDVAPGEYFIYVRNEEGQITMQRLVLSAVTEE